MIMKIIMIIMNHEYEYEYEYEYGKFCKLYK